ncbi:transposase [Rhodoferax sp. WC2427]|uniref:IS66 family transposase n=1 Tax=Rhodoferax sp. WC2427 TaxID=3234144 RepID=UPI003466FEA2
MLQRQQVPDGSATTKALDHNVRSWEALTLFPGHAQVTVGNNWIEKQIRLIKNVLRFL